MRKLSAHYIFPVSSPPIKNGIVVLNDDNIIVDIQKNPKHKEQAKVEFYSGILIPGLVNTHCHLELSALYNKIEPGKGISNFIISLLREKKLISTNQFKHAIAQQDTLMHSRGIVCVGDISNDDITIDTKKNSPISYHTFLEIYGLNKKEYSQKLDNIDTLLKQFSNNYLSTSVTPHAPYSMGKELSPMIQALYKGAISIHNQESAEEIELFNKQKGPLHKMLSNNKNDVAYWETKDSFWRHIENHSNPVILVHNTFTAIEDIQHITKHVKNPYWILCPSANLFIENNLPDVYLFIKEEQTIALGTDSLASNQKLCILEEMKVILQNFPHIKFEDVLAWATINGAKALNKESKFGSLEKGKQPGINLINNFDFINFTLSNKSNIKKLV